jgi:hypothetical protein
MSRTTVDRILVEVEQVFVFDGGEIISTQLVELDDILVSMAVVGIQVMGSIPSCR